MNTTKPSQSINNLGDHMVLENRSKKVINFVQIQNNLTDEKESNRHQLV